jgi:hypothetical protein
VAEAQKVVQSMHKELDAPPRTSTECPVQVYLAERWQPPFRMRKTGGLGKSQNVHKIDIFSQMISFQASHDPILKELHFHLSGRTA